MINDDGLASLPTQHTGRLLPERLNLTKLSTYTARVHGSRTRLTYTTCHPLRHTPHTRAGGHDQRRANFDARRTLDGPDDGGRVAGVPPHQPRGTLSARAAGSDREPCCHQRHCSQHQRPARLVPVVRAPATLEATPHVPDVSRRVGGPASAVADRQPAADASGAHQEAGRG